MTRIAQFGLQTLEAISCLITANHYMQALVVLYSAIDTLAWSTRGSGDVTRGDFCRWVTQYMQPEATLGCTPKDLYGARCALLHSGSAESKMSREVRRLRFGTRRRKSRCQTFAWAPFLAMATWSIR